MRIPYRERWLLRRLNRSLRQSDPHLAAMLAIFARLHAGEVITSVEQAMSPDARACRGLAWLAVSAARLAAVLMAGAGRILVGVARACATAGRRFSRAAWAALGISSPAGPALRRDGPGLPAS
jgi:hypothetical protein